MRVLGADADCHAVPNALTAGLDRDALCLARLVAHEQGCIQDSDENVRQLPGKPYLEMMRSSHETATKTLTRANDKPLIPLIVHCGHRTKMSKS